MSDHFNFKPPWFEKYVSVFRCKTSEIATASEYKKAEVIAS